MHFAVGGDDIRFCGVLARWLVQILVELEGRPRQCGMLYSHSALKGMLRKAGFDEIDSFWAAPEMRYPSHYVPNDVASIREARLSPGFAQGEMRSTRLLMQLIPDSLVKHFTPGLAVLATKRR